MSSSTEHSPLAACQHALIDEPVADRPTAAVA
jgi:hypothetical protein